MVFPSTCDCQHGTQALAVLATAVQAGDAQSAALGSLAFCGSTSPWGPHLELPLSPAEIGETWTSSSSEDLEELGPLRPTLNLFFSGRLDELGAFLADI